MASVKAVKEPEADPKAGKPRAKSGVSFPYFDLTQSIEVAKAMHERAGGTCDLAQLATLLDYSGVKNGAFRMRVSAAKMFGLIEPADEQKLRVSARGLAIVAPISEAQAIRAKLDAFLAIELFKKVYEQYHGTSLPEAVGLRNQLQTEYQVVQDRIAPTIRIMLDSAEQAGLFTTAGNRSRMVMPLAAPSAVAPPPATLPPAVQHDTTRQGGNGGNGGGDDGLDIDPAILGLLKRLPPGGTPLSAKRRKTLIEAFTATVNFIYPEADAGETL
jgi:hypothetical protein